MKLWQWCGALGLGISGAITAQPPLDTDHDGTVSLGEFEAPRLEAMRARFAALDTDHDGQLSESELAAMHRRFDHAGPAGPRAAIDTDGDGAWSLSELQVARPDFTLEQFNRLDRNGDGLITADERPMGAGSHGMRRGRPPQAGAGRRSED